MQSGKIPVEIVPIGKFSDDVALKSVTIVPKEVTVSGRKQLVNAVNKVVMRLTLLVKPRTLVLLVH